MKRTALSVFLSGTMVLTVLLTGLLQPLTAKAAISVVPPRFEIFGNPGDTIVERLRIINDEDTQITFSVDIEDFTAGDDEGGVEFLDEDDQDTTSFRLARWVSVEPGRFTVNAGEERTIDIQIRIPSDAEPGGHFASVLVRRSGAQVEGGAAVDTRVGTLILLRVAGDVQEKAAIDFFRPQDRFAQYGPVTLELRTQNNGNVHIAPKGNIVITDIFGRKVAELPLTTANVLPGSARIARTVWEQKNLVGRYTATLVAQYGQNPTGQEERTLSATTTFIVFPLYLLWIIIAVLVIGYLLITQRKKVKKFLNSITSD